MNTNFAWHPQLPDHRSLFLRFRLDFTYGSDDTLDPLRLFADSRYRLWLDGEFVTYGPARFTPDRPEYDTIDLSARLSPGTHQLAIEVLHRGERCFQAVCHAPGLWAEGQIRHADGSATELGTPGNWICSPSSARSIQAPEYSFAVSSIEIYDARKESPAWTVAPTKELSDWSPAHAIEAADWGKLRPRSIPQPSFEPKGASSTALLAPTREDETVISAGAHVSSLQDIEQGGHLALVTWIHSDTPQRITVGAIGECYALNGHALAPRPKDAGITGLLERKNRFNGDKNSGSRRTFDLDLQTGWNLFCGVVPFLGSSWAAQIAFPRSSVGRPEPDQAATPGIKICFDPKTASAFDSSWPADNASLPGEPWITISAQHDQQIPSLRSAWDLPSTEQQTPDPQVQELPLPLSSEGSAILVQDFERSCVGHIYLEITAPAGTIVDVSTDERRNPAGTVPLYRAHPNNHMADRYICSEGRQTYEGFHPRGGRYCQLNVRNANGPVTVHRLALRDRQGPIQSQGSFSSSDPMLDKIWNLCRDCILESLDDSWIDGWREHGVYLGDSVVQFDACSLLNFEQSAAYLRRTLQLFLSCQRSDGQLFPCVPSQFRSCHPDFTLLWGIILHDYWQRSGDTETVRSLWVGIERIHQSAYWQADEDGLWTSIPQDRSMDGAAKPFIDWGVEVDCRWGKANLAMNALRVRFLNAAARLGDAIGNTQSATAYRSERDAVAEALQRRLWSTEEGRFADYLDEDDQHRLHRGAHGNVFAYLAEIATPEQSKSLLDFIENRCGENREIALQGNEFGGQMELYFCNYTLQVLGKAGRAGTAEQLIRDMWDLHFEHDAKGCWEALCRGPVWGVGSVCHSWSVAPLIYAHRYILGVQWDFASEPGVVHVRPLPGSLEHARGSVSLPGDACLHVAWKRQPNGELKIETELHGADYQIVVQNPKPNQSVSVKE